MPGPDPDRIPDYEQMARSGELARAQAGDVVAIDDKRRHAAELARDVVAAFVDNPPKPIGSPDSPPMQAADAELYRSAYRSACDYLIDYFRSLRQPVNESQPSATANGPGISLDVNTPAGFVGLTVPRTTLVAHVIQAVAAAAGIDTTDSLELIHRPSGKGTSIHASLARCFPDEDRVALDLIAVGSGV